MALRGIVFDKDGTLTDFRATWINTYWEAARATSNACQGLISPKDLLALGGYESETNRFNRNSVLASGSTAELSKLWSDASAIDTTTVLRILEHFFRNYAASDPAPATDLPTLLAKLKEKNFYLGVATMDSETLAHRTLEILEITQYFSFVCGYDSGFGEKPGSGMIVGFCNQVGLSPEEVLVVGDTMHDINMGRSAGVAVCVGVLTGASEYCDLAEDADHVLDNISGLLQLV